MTFFLATDYFCKIGLALRFFFSFYDHRLHNIPFHWAFKSPRAGDFKTGFIFSSDTYISRIFCLQSMGYPVVKFKKYFFSSFFRKIPNFTTFLLSVSIFQGF